MANHHLTHLDPKGKPKMVNVSEKAITSRTAKAQSLVSVSKEIALQLKDNEIKTKKGPVFHTAILAGIMGLKQTSQLIPLCHPLAITGSDIQIGMLDAKTIRIVCEVTCEGKTGVEMEALTGATIAALTIYDMLKGFSQEMEIIETKLLVKTGGKSDVKRS